VVLYAVDLFAYGGSPWIAGPNTETAGSMIIEAPLKPGTHFMRVQATKIDPNGPEPQVYMKGEVSPQVALEEGGLLKYVLPNLISAVETTVSNLSVVFSGRPS
jgi:hypothetical protein